MKYLEEIKSTESGKDLMDFLKKTFVKEEDYNQLYYQENLTERYFDKNGLSDKKGSIPEIKDKLDKLNHFKKTKYYALLKYDGDKMGEHLSGVSLPKEKEANLRLFHETLSKQLAAFAKYAREEILISPHGKTVYAGGDDFLGFVNLHSVFSIAEKLRIKFNERINEPLKQEFKLEKPLTFSAGIVIAHYKTPLHIVLHNATNLLDEVAKKKLDRDAFAIRLLKHSGESHECGFKWELKEQNMPLKNLQWIVEQLKENFSTNFIQVLNQEMRLLHQETVDTLVITGEINRLVKRSAQKDDLDKEKVALVEILKSLNDRSDATDRGVENFLEALNICKFMHREIG
jgi:CRISPR-associated protein Cmr2